MFDTVWPVANGARHCAPLSRWQRLSEAKRRNAREEKVNKHGNQWQRRLDGCSMETFQASAGRATLFIQLVNCPMPPALLGRPTFLLEFATTKLRKHNPREVFILEIFSTHERGSRMTFGVWNTFCFCNLGLFVNLLMGLDFPWQIAV